MKTGFKNDMTAIDKVHFRKTVREAAIYTDKRPWESACIQRQGNAAGLAVTYLKVRDESATSRSMNNALKQQMKTSTIKENSHRIHRRNGCECV